MRYSLPLSIALLTATASSVAAMHLFTSPAASTMPAEEAVSIDVPSPAEQHLIALDTRYRIIAQNGGWPSFPVGDTIKPGMSDARIPVLRQILKILGDSPDTAPNDTIQYDSALQEATMHFQQRHGLNADGAIGKETQLALNTPVDFRITQIEATLARLKKARGSYEERYVLVNLPEYHLYAYDHGVEALDMNVIIGDPKHHTPVFTNAITYMTFNPHWGVPVKIAVEEMLPKLRKDPHYLQANNYAVFSVSKTGRTEVDPSTIDWSTLSRHHFPYMLRQRPGEDNALGKVKFGLVDSDDIYLHSTSKPQLFAKDMRALSHGCMRLAEPREMVDFVVKDEKKLTPEKAESYYDSDETRTISVTPLPVHVVYYTAWADELTGEPYFRKDVYGLDAKYARTGSVD